MTLTPAFWLVAPLVALPTAIALTKTIRERAVAREILDHPNDRSSHAVPTPRGGGLSVVILTLGFVALAGATGLLGNTLAISLLGGGLIVAVVGLLDDVRPVTARTRLLAHFTAAAWAVAGMGGMPTLRVGAESWDAGIVGGVLAVIGVVWSINFFNFMDGIDGLAGMETVFVAGLGASFLWAGGEVGLAVLCLVLAASTLGFLVWNWAPAKIFMGDVGSGFIGFVIASIAIASEKAGTVPVMVWAILGAAFIVDATVTFVRLLPHKPWSEAHRLHAYQRAVQAGWSHRRVSAAVAILNVALGGLATIAFVYPSTAPALVAVAFGLVGAAYYVVERIRPLKARES